MSVLYLNGVSLLTPLGADLAMVNASVNAAMSSYQQCEIMGDGEVTRFSPLPESILKATHPLTELPGWSPPQIRLLGLATFALNDLADELPSIPLPLFLAGPQSYYLSGGLNPHFLKHLEKVTGVTLDIENSRCLSSGRAGAIEAIDIAFKYFDATKAHYALIGGIDSFYDRRTLNILKRKGRLMADNSFDGFVPGEGAAFLLLTSEYAPEAMRQQSLLTLHEPSTAREPGHILNDAPYTGETLADVFRGAMGETEKLINTIYSSENGEMHYAKELNVTRLRQQHRLSPQYHIHRPAEYFGDLGAAFVPVAIALASTRIKQQSEQATLVYGSSDGGSRAALCLSASSNV